MSCNNLTPTATEADTQPWLAQAVRAVAPAAIEQYQHARAVAPAGASGAAARVDAVVFLHAVADCLDSKEPDLEAAAEGASLIVATPSVADWLAAERDLKTAVTAQLREFDGRPLTAGECHALHAAFDTVIGARILRRIGVDEADRQRRAESRARYLSTVSHDLRGTLNGVLLMIEVLRRELQGHEQFAEAVGDLESMRRSVLDSVTLMDRFVQAEKMQTGRIRPKPSSLAVRSVIDAAIAAAAHDAAEKSVALKMAPSTNATPTAISSDRDLLTLALQSLVANAVRYTRAGNVEIAEQPVEASAGPAVRITVTDTGPGIAPDLLARLLQPLTSGSVPAGQRAPGLGMTLAYLAVQLLGGRLTGKSELGKGSTFAIELPAHLPGTTN